MRKWIAAAVALLAWATPAAAATIEAKDVKGTTFISIIDEIKDGDAAVFKRLAAQHEKAVVLLLSEGGSLSEALEIGRVVAVSGYMTAVPDDTVCASSCALIWLAGTDRSAFSGSRIGFHASYTIDGGKPIPSGMANAMVGRYLTLLNLPARAVVFATSAPPEGMLWLDTAKPGAEGIPYDVIPDEEEDAPSTPTTTASVRSRAAPPVVVPVQPKSSVSNGIDGKRYGAWTVKLTDGIVGAMSDSVSGDGRLSYMCITGKRCRYVVKIGLNCNPGERYSVKYAVEGYPRKDVGLTCDEDGDMFHVDNSSSFRDDVDQEVAVTIHAENEAGEAKAMRFSLIGLPQAIDALTTAGHVGVVQR